MTSKPRDTLQMNRRRGRSFSLVNPISVDNCRSAQLNFAFDLARSLAPALNLSAAKCNNHVPGIEMRLGIYIAYI